MSKRAVAVFVVVFATLGAGSAAAGMLGAHLLVRWITSRVDDPAYFCASPDPTPLRQLGSETVLQECDAGKTVTITLDQLIAVDLVASFGVDTGTYWGPIRVSDASLLQTVAAPSTINARPRFDELAQYRGLRRGQAAITAVFYECGANGCDRGHKWTTTVRVA